MNLKLLILLIVISNIAFGQRKAQKKSYPADLDEIRNIKSSYIGCTNNPCYSWWSIALKDSTELIAQSGGHYPVGAKSKHFPIGTWRISGDTLILNIIPESMNTDFLRTEYRIINLYDCEILIPIDNSENWDVFLKDVQVKFEQLEEFKMLGEKSNPKLISMIFYHFVMQNYSSDKKLLVKRKELNY